MLVLRKIITVVFAVMAMFSIAGPAEATVIASGDLSLSNFNFSSTASNAQLVWTDVWYGTAQAQAQDTDSGTFGNSSDFLGNSGSISIPESSADVNSSASFSVVNGDQMNPTIEADTHFDLGLAGAGKQAGAAAISTFDNYFVLTGGNFGDSVDVTFQLDHAGQLSLASNPLDYSSIALDAFIKIEDLSGNLVGSDLVGDIPTGTGLSYSQLYDGTLTISTTLFYGVDYWFYAEAGLNPDVSTPEPGTVPLLMFGLGLLPFALRPKAR